MASSSRVGASGLDTAKQFFEKLAGHRIRQPRFALSDDGERIRASQGHSIEVDLALSPVQPPALLYHGTASRFVESIRAGGLHSANRRHVHLSADVATATKVGQRHGKPVVLVVKAGGMAAAGHVFFLSANGVWLTERVPVKFLDFPAE